MHAKVEEFTSLIEHEIECDKANIHFWLYFKYPVFFPGRLRSGKLKFVLLQYFFHFCVCDIHSIITWCRILFEFIFLNFEVCMGWFLQRLESWNYTFWGHWIHKMWHEIDSKINYILVHINLNYLFDVSYRVIEYFDKLFYLNLLLVSNFEKSQTLLYVTYMQFSQNRFQMGQSILNYEAIFTGPFHSLLHFKANGIS